jgi:hypothetical protein
MIASTGRIEINTIAEAKVMHTSILTTVCWMLAERGAVNTEMMMMVEIVERAEVVEITAAPVTCAVVVVRVILPAMDEVVDAVADNR